MNRNRQRIFRQWGAATAALMLAVFNGAAQSNGVPAAAGFSGFEVIVERNIFDPNRHPQSSPARDKSAPVTEFSVVGTLDDRQGRFAFFDGSSPEFRTVLKTGEAIAGYQVKAITVNGVELADGGRRIEMKMGAQMRQQSGGQWELDENAAAPAVEDDAATPDATPSTAATAPAGDVLKRLMERRKQELK
ncbi:MAG: hypothetical protein KGR98_06045 [Verrucomicrobia bacterium]|nr:hypothetical protein [Verrucomicrobiota bacterium]MDE3099538.1 hypothetical protein [Verrucomicrobiota bacterium]